MQDAKTKEQLEYAHRLIDGEAASSKQIAEWGADHQGARRERRLP